MATKATRVNKLSIDFRSVCPSWISLFFFFLKEFVFKMENKHKLSFNFFLGDKSSLT